MSQIIREFIQEERSQDILGNALWVAMAAIFAIGLISGLDDGLRVVWGSGYARLSAACLAMGF
ncbi:MAG TPA: hypothetical protein VKU19_09030 [Bryobacteraceae bacterium]|nr:hypothetical protein [Bryobacteraceae bacterium]